MATPAAVLQILVTANSAQAVSALRATDAQAKKTAASTSASTSRMSRAYSSMASVAKTALVGGVAYGLYAGVKAGIDFEKQMDAVGAVSDASAKQMRKLEQQALRLGQKTTFSATEAAQAQEELAKGGLKASDILGGALKSSLSLAAAGQLDLATAAQTTVNAMKLFGLRAKDAEKVADMFATAANKTTADVEDFAMALRQGGSAAKAAGYDLNQTMVVLEALAEAGIKNSDAGTSMKTAMLQLLAPTQKQADLAKQLGIEWVNQNGNLKSAAGLSKELQGALGGMTNAQQAANLKVLAGTDGFRTLNALMDEGPAKLRELAQANEEQGTAQEVAKKKMDNTAGSIEQLKGAWETLSISLFKKAESPFRSVIDSMTKGVQKFTDVVTDKHLTTDEKISKVIEMISDALQDAIPKVAGIGAKIGAAILKGMAGAFIHGDVFTKLFVAATFIKMIGGMGTLTSLGTALGNPIGQAAAIAIAAAIAFEMEKEHHFVAKAAFQRKTVTKDDLIGDFATFNTEDLRTRVEVWKSLGKISEKAVWKWVESGKITAEQGQRVINVLQRVEKVAGTALIALGKSAGKAGDSVKDFTQKGADWLRDFTEKGKGAMDKLGRVLRGPLIAAIEKASNEVKDFTSKGADWLRNLADASDKSASKFERSMKTVGRSVTSAASVVTNGLGIIIDNTNKALKGFGVKKVSISLAGAGAAATNFGQGHQTGGVIVPGQGDGDKVPAMLEPGEVVWNKKAVAAMGGASKANRVNSMVPRFATGGVIQQALGPYSIPPIAYDPNHAGGNSHLHLDFFTKQQALSYGHKMQGMGWRIGEYTGSNPYGFGPVTTQHQSPGHYDGTAFDANKDPETRSDVAAVARLLNGGKVSAAIAERIARVILKGPDGPLKSMGQAALDKVRDAANKFIASKAPNGEMGPGSPMKGLPKALQKYNQVYPVSSGFGDGYSMPFNAVAALAEWAGAPGVSMARTAIGESQLEPGAVGTDPGGTHGLGLWMITTGYNDALISKLGGEAKMRNPVINAQAMNSIFDSQGIGAWYSQTADSSNTHYDGPLLRKLGGIVPHLAKGGKPDKPGKAGFEFGPIDPAWRRFTRARRIAERLKALVGERGRIARLDERIQMAETLAGQDSSELGSDLGPGERQKQIRLNEQLLARMVMARKLARTGLHWLDFPKGMSTTGLKKSQLKNLSGTFNTALTDLTGVTGKGGRIFDTKIQLDTLKNTTTGSATPLDISGLRAVIEAARYGAFDGFFAKGGSVGAGKWGIAGERGPEIVRGPATVQPTSMAAPTVNVENNFDWQGMDLYVETKVNGVVAKRERIEHRKARQYA